MTITCDSRCILISVMLVIIAIQSVTLYFAKFETRFVIKTQKNSNYVFVMDQSIFINRQYLLKTIILMAETLDRATRFPMYVNAPFRIQ